MKKMKKNKAVSAIIGIILMVAITVAIAATVLVYVQRNVEETRPIETTGVIVHLQYPSGQQNNTQTVVGINSTDISYYLVYNGSFLSSEDYSIGQGFVVVVTGKTFESSEYFEEQYPFDFKLIEVKEIQLVFQK